MHLGTQDLASAFGNLRMLVWGFDCVVDAFACEEVDDLLGDKCSFTVCD